MNLVETNGHPPIQYPTNHEVGMTVPVDGSNCAKCKFVDGQDCTNKLFVKWNKGPMIPDKVDRYCCDFFTIGESNGSFRMAKVFKEAK